MSRIETVEVGGTEYTLGVDKDSTVTFTEAQTRTNIASGESLATMFGKIKKFFTDLKTVAFTGNVADMSDVTITSPASGDTLFHNGTGWENKNLMVEVTKAEYDALVANNEDDSNVDYHITDIDVAEAYYVETSGQTALTGATSLTFTNSHIKPTADIRILAEPNSCKVATNPQYKVSAKLSSVGSGTATITFPALAENTEFWLLIECPLAITQNDETKADKIDLTSINVIGSTNTTGSTISAGTYFYLNGLLVRAKINIATNATFTLNTNYEVVTSGAVNLLNNAVTQTNNSVTQINNRFVFNTLLEPNKSTSVDLKTNKNYLIVAHSNGDRGAIAVLSTTYGVHLTFLVNVGTISINYNYSGQHVNIFNQDSMIIALSITEL